MNITIAKALKLKNRLAAKLAHINGEISKNNSIMDGTKRDIDVVSHMDKHNKLISVLITLKMEIFKANVAIQELIFQNAELKGEIAFYQALNTKEGEERNRYSMVETKPTVYSTVITYSDVQKKITELEHQLDANQDKIDNFNYNTEIDVPALINELLV